MNSYATPTPAIEAGRVYLHFGSYGTVCLNTQTGEKIWERRDLPCDHYRGPASSPILHGHLLIVPFDGYDLQYVVALDKSTGETVWRTERDINYNTDNGDLKKAYGTASVIEVSGREQLIVPSAIATEAFDPTSGDRLWTVYHEGMNASLRPVSGHGLVFLTNGMGGMVAVRPDGKGNVTDSHIAWSSTKSVAKKTSQLLIGNDLYMIADSGILSRRDAVSGELLWQERLDGEFAASPIYAGGLIYLANTEGTIYVVRPGESFELVASAALGDGYMASPAVAGDQLILRSKSRLFCLKNE
jgi:outer membrane protein assembly factor BamB